MRTFSDLFRNMMQIGYVTEDIDVAAEYFERTLGTVPCRKHYKSSLGGIVFVDGDKTEEWVIDVAMVNAGATNLEIIRPVSGAVDLYRAAIRPGVPATLHHLAFRVSDFAEAEAVVTASGKTWAQNGYLEGSTRFGYVDMTAELGHYVEVMELEPAAVESYARLEAESNGSLEQPSVAG